MSKKISINNTEIQRRIDRFVGKNGKAKENERRPGGIPPGQTPHERIRFKVRMAASVNRQRRSRTRR